MFSATETEKYTPICGWVDEGWLDQWEFESDLAWQDGQKKYLFYLVLFFINMSVTIVSFDNKTNVFEIFQVY